MKREIIINRAPLKLTSCSGCPNLIAGQSFGNDGRDGHLTHKCGLGVWGGQQVFNPKNGPDPYYMQYHEVPKSIPDGCPLLPSEAEDE